MEILVPCNLQLATGNWQLATSTTTTRWDDVDFWPRRGAAAWTRQVCAKDKEEGYILGGLGEYI
jgi:hypothetical protein